MEVASFPSRVIAALRITQGSPRCACPSSRLSLAAALKLAILALPLLVDQLLQFGHELGDVAERAIDRREPDVGHFVEPAQVLHHLFAQKSGEDLLFTRF